ncbi:19196_t:CDS:2 [Cetraspora pellucida]|uniref:19196_t:CDS:1 n=1 Tax=Cetraspora pellucida TaxID=1433469 RepID=A0A9N9GA89_9GLOM|nr:19196_t:CDS:2 [Cetraspora pellucida]
MAPRTKRQKQISNLPREKGYYLNQKNQIFMKSLNITTIESQEEWTENELVEFEGVGTRLINEILRWHKDAAKHLRTENYFIKTEELLPYCQGKHTKLESLIDAKDFTYIEDTLFPKLIGHIKEDTILKRTCRNYMYLWGFKYDERRKSIFFDGHEKPDVVAYRNEWLKRMFVYKKNIKDFVSESLEFVLELQLNLGKKEYVQITHDECYFYANDGRRRIWIQKGKNILRLKHLGHFIMVSAFLCSCHGLLRLTDQQLYENLYIKNKETFVIHSVQVDGYWKAEHMLEQLVSKVIPVFEILHPGCIGMFCFDQSTNHNAMAEDALIAKRMNLSSGGKQPVMRNGWFIDKTRKKYVQSMVFSNDYQKEELRGKQKGLRQMLEE